MGKARAKRVRRQEPYETLPVFNHGDPLTVVQLPDGRLGVVDGATMRVWVEYDMVATTLADWRTYPRICIPELPKKYGAWKLASIGGVSRTVRRVGCLRTCTFVHTPVSLFALNMPRLSTARDVLDDHTDRVSVGEEAIDPEFGNVAEVTVFCPEDVDFVAARLMRAGVGQVKFEDPEKNAMQCIGIERLDRIDSSVGNRDSEDHRFDRAEFGLGRGEENWIFSWLPAHWTHLPVTWDYMVLNVASVRDVEDLPPLLRQHVAKSRYELLDDPTTPEALELKKVFCRPDGSLRKRLRSAGLTPAQSKQACTCFFASCIERVDDPLVRKAANLVLYQYMLRVGYMARYLGKYDQNALCIGNGDATRNFRKLEQYDPPHLPASVINKKMSRSGEVEVKGNKGSRSKYVKRADRYIPKVRFTKGRTHRTKEDE